MDFNQTFNEELPSILFKVFYEEKNGGGASTLLYEVRIMLIPKSNKDTSWKQNFRPIILMYIKGNLVCFVLNSILQGQGTSMFIAAQYTKAKLWRRERKGRNSGLKWCQQNACMIISQ